MRRGGASRAAGALVALLLATEASRPARATARFVINNLDPAGIGFNDPTPALPVGNNQGTTLGMQRQIAFQFAADVWAAALDSAVPIVVDAHFTPLACAGGLVILGHARAQTIVASIPPRNVIPGLPPNILFPQPLADRLAGVDLDPGVADLVATFNGDLHACDPNLDWYYGLDGNAGSLTDLVEVVVHELGHGLGFATAVDPTTGAFTMGIPDAFSTHVFDNSVAMAWLDMTDAQRLASMRHVRQLVWNGDNVRQVAATKLAHGVPTLVVTPEAPGLAGDLGETNFGPLIELAGASGLAGPSGLAGVSGPLVVGNPITGCAGLSPRAGGIFLLAGGTVCSALNQADYASRAGALAVLLADANGFAPPSSVELPPDQLRQLPVNIPVLTISRSDGQLLIDNLSRAPIVTLGADATRLAGADANGRPFLYASDPIRPGSTASHWDPLARPDLVEEPESGYEHPHDIRLEAALLRDIGWAPYCGNGRPDPGEECDDGAANSDSVPDTCRTSCRGASCGDGVKDSDEACDQGASNGTAQSACTAACTLATPTGPGTGGSSARGCACTVPPSAPPAREQALPLAVVVVLCAGALGARRRPRVRPQNSRTSPSLGMRAPSSPSDSVNGSSLLRV